MQKQNSVARERLRRVCICGVLVAAAIVLCRVLGFPQDGIWRVEFSFLPMALVAYLYGPLWAGVSYGAADLLGAAITTGINPFITLEKVLMGVVFGMFMHKPDGESIGHRRILSCQLLTGVLLDALMMAIIFFGAFGYTWGVALTTRSINAVVNVAIRSVTLVVFDKSLFPRLGRMRKEQHV